MVTLRITPAAPTGTVPCPATSRQVGQSTRGCSESIRAGTCDTMPSVVSTTVTVMGVDVPSGVVTTTGYDPAG
ncbi:hypothetical protein ASF78_19055 [Cellulomonas sp. Leaf334]|nr:hypothetical protein ASF78_19055 [Cellulomonas sp. Leaf334]